MKNGTPEDWKRDAQNLPKQPKAQRNNDKFVGVMLVGLAMLFVAAVYVVLYNIGHPTVVWLVDLLNLGER